MPEQPKQSFPKPSTWTIAAIIVLFVLFGFWTTDSEYLTPPPTDLNLPSGSTPTLGTVVTDGSGTLMDYVPPGCFMMGKDAAIDRNGHRVTPFKMCLTKGYWIDQTDVTNAAYQKFIDAGGYNQPGTWWNDVGWAWLSKDSGFWARVWSFNGPHPYDYEGFTAPQQPRVGIMWYEASAYCRWRGARLPTEPEWEYAARGPNSLDYPWGNTFDPAKVVYNGSDTDVPAPVGSKPASRMATTSFSLPASVSVTVRCFSSSS